MQQTILALLQNEYRGRQFRQQEIQGRSPDHSDAISMAQRTGALQRNE
jgi:hypothetical protein